MSTARWPPRIAGALWLWVGVGACADRAPEPKWPEPPPPTVAEPLGQEKSGPSEAEASTTPVIAPGPASEAAPTTPTRNEPEDGAVPIDR